MTKKVLVIGGCGFIGSHIVDALLAAGVSVRVLDRRPETFREPLPEVEYNFGDFSDPFQLLEALESVDAVMHCASTTVPSTSNVDPVADITGNLISTVRLLKLLRQMNIKKLVYLSSGGTVYGVPQHNPVTEDHPQNPISSYGIVKSAIEKYIYMEEQLGDLSAVVLRASNPYGPRQGHTGIQGIIGTYLWKLARGENLEVWGDGTVVRDFIYVRDMADICVAALHSDQSGVFNAGAGEGNSVNDIVQAVRAATGKDFQPSYRNARSYDVPRIVLDIERAKAAFGWAPRVSLQDGVSESWKWVQSQARAQG
ncbi:NAD-dependent epimerase/dehydratase family protein [Mangrovicoccus algicola]|uniref:UDP-glucose 4-epimerase n=1 Tax=Mangrovicoccus algicola TaxID=2771008 RepID=A0A8J7CYQ8_9RHOB|nr:NAD-dependent epimerase/dehydratase family protein [Mangrovicoccus algicola]MBE3636838.1 NAD-dependent epimerase/dehydratase family protein [Mangrovicoccus algicola]